ncbi:MAG: response regulator [Rhodanobacteraceae bacterium]
MAEPTDTIMGLHVFLAEDEFHVLQLIEDMLVDLGCVIADSVSSLDAALERAGETKAQVAILDVNLRGRAAYPAALALRDRGIPVVFSTGYGAAGLEPEWQDCPVVQKPFASEQLAATLMQIASNLPNPVPAA